MMLHNRIFGLTLKNHTQYIYRQNERLIVSIPLR